MEKLLYNSQSIFPYADGLYMILPSGLPERFYSGSGENVIIANEVMCFKPYIPNEIKARFIKDYSEYVAKQNDLGVIYDRYLQIYTKF